MRYHFYHTKGFTLIELVIVTSIIMLLTGGAVSNYQGFNDKQKVTQALSDLTSNLRLTQTKAINGVKPNLTDPFCQDPLNNCTCTSLVGYTVTFTGSNYSIQALCNNTGSDIPVGPITSVKLSDGVTFPTLPSPNPIILYGLTRGASTSQTITLSGIFGTSESFTIASNGLVTYGTPTPTLLATATPTPVATATPTPIPVGDGLKGDYYDNKDFTNFVVTRVDPKVDFDWGSGKAHPSLTDNDKFSIRWTGFVQTLGTGEYKFFVDSNDGHRIWVNGQKLFDNWNDGSQSDGKKITLAANQKYSIKLEYYEKDNNARCKLSWRVPDGSEVVIPQSNLFTSL